jgi:2-polyprenyl-3-methyl-5-hydroxy-6-metoxy-1,4-benzoquinol methylase
LHLKPGGYRLPDEQGRRELRDRLYSEYSQTHAGAPSHESQMPGFDRDIRPHIPANRNLRILDIGCGQGHYVRRLLALGYEQTRGIDISPEQVAIAMASGLTQVAAGDYAEALQHADLDVVIATDFLEHLTVAESLEAVDKINRALKPGGLLIVRVPNGASPFAGGIRYADLTHQTMFTAQSLRQLGTNAGFRSVQIFPCPPPVHGAASALRAALWRLVSGGMKLALAAETGQLRGHVVTQNIVAVMRLGPNGDQSLDHHGTAGNEARSSGRTAT